jgi:hypothetical protein
MSKYNRQKSTYNDRDCLVAALNEQGYTDVEVHEEAVNLIGYHGDTRPEKANVIVRRKHIGTAANDLGFVKEADGTYSAIVSDYDSRKHGAVWMTGLKKAYTEKRLIKHAAKNGLKYLGKKVVNNKVQIQWMDTRSA